MLSLVSFIVCQFFIYFLIYLPIPPPLPTHREQQALSSITEKIATYETMFEQLKKMTGADRLEEVSQLGNNLFYISFLDNVISDYFFLIFFAQFLFFSFYLHHFFCCYLVTFVLLTLFTFYYFSFSPACIYVRSTRRGNVQSVQFYSGTFYMVDGSMKSIYELILNTQDRSGSLSL